ncbi:MAG: hypothetical protein KAS64_08045 [Spirochaetes bacterium]|nr:hypothetical protein [Spirochaetota bacterium]
MSTKITAYAILIIFLFTFNLTADEGIKIQNQVRIQEMLKTELKLQQKTAEKLMKQLKKQLKEMNQKQLYMGEETVKQLARICNQYRLNIQDTAKILAVGSLYTQQLKNYGIEKKQIRRELSMNVIKELSTVTASDSAGDKVVQKLQKQLKLQKQDRKAAGGGHKGNTNNYRNQNQNKNTHSYYGERSNSGTAGKKQSGSSKSGK